MTIRRGAALLSCIACILAAGCATEDGLFARDKLVIDEVTA